MRLKRETQGAFCVLNANAKSQTRKSMKINVICTVHAMFRENIVNFFFSHSVKTKRNGQTYGRTGGGGGGRDNMNLD